MHKTDYTKIIKEYFSKRREALCVYLFGSAASDKENKYSDVDIAVLYDDSVSPAEYTDKRIALSIELSTLLDKDTDIIILNQAPPYLKFQIIQSGARVYENPARKTRTFEARSVLEYFDFEPLKNRMESSLIKRIKEVNNGSKR